MHRDCRERDLRGYSNAIDNEAICAWTYGKRESKGDLIWRERETSLKKNGESMDGRGKWRFLTYMLTELRNA